MHLAIYEELKSKEMKDLLKSKAQLNINSSADNSSCTANSNNAGVSPTPLQQDIPSPFYNLSSVSQDQIVLDLPNDINRVSQLMDTQFGFELNTPGEIISQNNSMEFLLI